MGLRDSLKKVEKNAARPGGRLKRIRKSAMWMAPAFLVMTCDSGLAQNAAQRAALAHLMQPHANTAPASGVEATSVPLYQPGGLAFDATGNLYIADTNDNIVREVNLSGIISTVAGKFRMDRCCGVGSHTAFTASQISTAKSSSVPVKLSGLY